MPYVVIQRDFPTVETFTLIGFDLKYFMKQVTQESRTNSVLFATSKFET